MASSFPRSPVFSSSKCSGAATRAAQKLPVALAPSGTLKKMGSSFELNYLQNHLLQVPAPKAAIWRYRPSHHPEEQDVRQPTQQAGTHSPVWMMMCLDKSPTFTKALLHTLHLWGRMLSWWRM